jgi:hypothetical protein
MTTNAIPGGWSAYTTNISSEAMQVFETAMKIVGVNYEPLAVATQVVAGTNYSFFCNAQGVYPGAQNEGAMVDIYLPPNGIPHITSISKTPR